jgi:maleylacetate reductase
MRLLALSLKGILSEKENLEFRSQAQQGMWLSRIGSMAGVPMGASHGIGYLLGGGYGVPHGITSCITLHAVLTWNACVKGHRQADVAEAFGGPRRSAGEVVREFVAALGLPTRLRDVGLQKEELPKIAASWDGAPPIATNPRKVNSQQELLEILELAY